MSWKVGFIGLGIMGHRMLNAMQRHPEFDLALAWDVSAEAREKVVGEFPGIRAAENAESLAGEADLVYIASPPLTHIGYARLALDAGKAIFCEKPLAVDVEDSRKLVEEVKRAGLRTGINFPFASSPVVELLESHVREERHGRAQRLDIRFHFSEWPRTWQRAAAGWLDKRADGGFVREVFSHFAYLTHRLIGIMEIRSARATFSEEGSERWVNAELDSGGLPIQVTGGVGGTAPDSNEWTLYGSDRTYRLQDWGLLKVSRGDRWYDLMPDSEPKPRLYEQLDNLAKRLRGEPSPLPDLEEGLRVQEVVEGILRGGH